MSRGIAGDSRGVDFCAERHVDRSGGEPSAGCLEKHWRRCWWCCGGKYATRLCCHSVQDGMKDLGYAKSEVQQVIIIDQPTGIGKTRPGLEEMECKCRL